MEGEVVDLLQKDKFQRLKFCVINFATFSHQFKKQKLVIGVKLIKLHNT